jgi:hypothetical protein
MSKSMVVIKIVKLFMQMSEFVHDRINGDGYRERDVLKNWAPVCLPDAMKSACIYLFEEKWGER